MHPKLAGILPADDKSRLLKIKIEEIWAPIWRQTA
jgi:hypothetical protein